MMNFFRTAKVISDNDPEELSRVQVRILPEFTEMQESMLPWAYVTYPGKGNSSETSVHNPPEIGSFVRVEIRDKFWKEIYVISDEFLEGFAAYEKWSTAQSGISELSNQTYPQPRFEAFKDGSIFFNNTDTGEKGVYHSSGSYVFMNSAGAFYVYSKDQETEIYNDATRITITAGGQIEIAGNVKHFVKWEDLNLSLQELILSLTTHVHADPISGSTGPPPAPFTLDLSASRTDNVLTEE